MGATPASDRRWTPSIWLVGGALTWSLLLIVAAVALPLYSATMGSSSGSRVETSETIVEVNGPSALIPVSIPAVVCALACLLLHLARRFGSRAAHRAAAVLAFLLAAFALLTAFSIGLLVLPAAIALVVAVTTGDPDRRGPAKRDLEHSAARPR